MTFGLVPASYNQLSLHPLPDSNSHCIPYTPPGGGGGTLGISGWGCAAGTLKPLTYTRASSAEFCYPLLE